MAFTIQVKKRTVDEDFTFSALVLTHEECGGGKMNTELRGSDWLLSCRRCNMDVSVAIGVGGTVAICKTAIDGQRRELSGEFMRKGVIVVQC
jgi:hypothetical protein